MSAEQRRIGIGHLAVAPILIVLLIATPGIIQAEDRSLLSSAAKMRALLAAGRIKSQDVPNPHWKRDACVACHESGAGFTRSNVRTMNTIALCENCHNKYTKAAFIHPTGQKIPTRTWKYMPRAYKKSLAKLGGEHISKITCFTCHDMVIQCLESRAAEEMINPLFFRLGPYRDRVQLCFFCHDSNLYKRFDPHKQIVRGRIDKKSCSLCHMNIKNLRSNSRLKDIKLRSSDDLNKLCINCHPWRPHPGWEIAKTKKKPANHLVKPPADMLVRMGRMERKTGVVLPLGPSDGKIHCATCHNPHQKGVIKSKSVNAGADSKRRLRLKESCTYCHEI